MKKWTFLFLIFFSFSLIAEQKPKILVGSPVRQKPAILKEFLESLEKVDQRNFTLEYCFVDDNVTEESKAMLRTFAQKHAPFCKLLNPEEGQSTEYVCNETTHYWSDATVWKVALFKDKIIELARQNDYDYLFFIDSDIVLHPKTIRQLLENKKEIVSEVFWTRWVPEAIPLPQVWLYDHYTQFEHVAGENISPEEVHKRRLDFYNKLKRPGVYEVGGLGACTLISKSAIHKGISFRRIPNVTFWGEDRHFCIRAAALGIALHVDTHYPAYHIYRESSLEGMAAFKRKCEKNMKRLTLGMLVHNEADRYLRKVLESAREYITDAVIIDDASTDNTSEVCQELLKGIPLRLIKNTESKFANEWVLRKQLWDETVKSDPEWILFLDADEVFEERFAKEVPHLLNNEDVDGYCFTLYDFWSESEYRDDALWNAHTRHIPFLVRYRPEVNYQWKETPQHCGRFPMAVFQFKMAASHLRLKHYGWSKEEDRVKKYTRYQKLDPNAIWGIKAQYDSILDSAPHLVKWVE